MTLQSPRPSSPSNASRAHSGGDTSTSVALRIFVVENHDDTRLILCQLLEQLGHSVTSVSTKADALAVLADRSFDVLLSDIGLSDGTGWELLASIAPERRPYAIAMSGFGQASDCQRSHEAGYRHHLLKPIRLDTLNELLDEAASQSH